MNAPTLLAHWSTGSISSYLVFLMLAAMLGGLVAVKQFLAAAPASAASEEIPLHVPDLSSTTPSPALMACANHSGPFCQ